MKRIISIFISATALLAAVPCVFAGDAVTAADVIAAQSLHALSADAAKLERFNKQTETDEEMRMNVNPSETYAGYNINSRLGDGEENIFESFDPEKDNIADVLINTNEYIYKEKGGVFEIGTLWEAEDEFVAAATNHYSGDRLFFSPSELAEVINRSGIGEPEDIRYIYDVDDFSANKARIAGGRSIYVKTGSGEYIITDIKYIDGELAYSLVLDREEFTEYMCGNGQSARDKAYRTMEFEDAPHFTDISGDKAVDLLVRMGIVSGYEDGSFGADRSITRAEAARMVAVAVTGTNRSIDAYEIGGVFSDVPEGFWATPYIAYGYIMEYISGMKNGGAYIIKNVRTGYTDDGIPEVKDIEIETYDFCPDDAVTEQQLVKMLVSAVEQFGNKMAAAEGGYPDGYVSVAKHLGICENASDKAATRLTAAHMIKNALDARVTAADSYVVRTDSDKSQIYETTYNKKNFYNLYWTGSGAKIHGTVTATSKTDLALRAGEIKFLVSENEDTYYCGDCAPGREAVFIAKYSDIEDYLGQECDMYTVMLGGNIVAVMAE